MMENQTHRNLVIRILTLLMLLLIAGTLAYSANQVLAEEGGSNLTDQFTVTRITSDCSYYTDQELPSFEQSYEVQIEQIVPVHYFERGVNNIYYYNGEKYGFVILNYNNYHYVIVFVIEYIKNGNGYSTQIKVKYSDAYYRYNSEKYMHAVQGYQLCMTNVTFNQYIIDQLNNNLMINYDEISNDGAFFIQALIEREGFIPQDKDVDWKVISDMAGLFPGEIGLAFGVYTLFDDWMNSFTVTEKTINIVGDIFNYPITKSEQLSSKSTGYHLMKAVQLRSDSDSQYFSTFHSEDNVEDYVKCSFLINNPSDLGYYIKSEIGFDLVLFNTEREAIHVKCGIKLNDLLRNDKTVNKAQEKIDTQTQEPYYTALIGQPQTMIFIPDESANYQFITTCTDTKVEVKGMPVSEQYWLIKGQRYEIAVTPSAATAAGTRSYKTVVRETQLAIPGRAFDCIRIVKHQELTDTDRTLTQYAYRDLYFGDWSNNVYEFSVREGNIADSELSLYDGDWNLLNRGVRVGNALRINYAFMANRVYHAVVKTQSGTVGKLTDLGQLACTERFGAQDACDVYYLLKVPYQGNYVMNERNLTISEADSGQVVMPNAEQAYPLRSDLRYIVKAKGNAAAIAPLEIPLSYFTHARMAVAYPTFGKNKIFDFTAEFSTNLTLGTPCDRYENGKFVGNAQTVSVHKGKTYHFVTTSPDASAVFEIGYDVAARVQGSTTVPFDAGVSVIRWTNPIAQRWQIVCDQTFTFTSADGTQIAIDHGYALQQGEYYLSIDAQRAGSVSIKEYLVPIELTLMNGQSVIALDQTVYYDRPFALPVPTHAEELNYGFDGWQDESGIFYTDEHGKSIRNICSDEPIILKAVFYARNLQIQVDMGDGSVKWWTGEGFVDSRPLGSISGDRFEIDVLYLTFTQCEAGNKVGHFFTSYEGERVSQQGRSATYRLTPHWQKEVYYVVFYDEKDIPCPQLLTYGERVTDKTYPTQCISPQKFGWRFDTWKWQQADVSIAGMTVPDLTPGQGTPFNYASQGSSANDSSYVLLRAGYSLQKFTIHIGESVVSTDIVNGYTLQSPEQYYTPEHRDAAIARFNGNLVFYRLGNRFDYYVGDRLDLKEYDMTIDLVLTPLIIDIAYNVTTQNLKMFSLNHSDFTLLNDAENIWSDFSGWFWSDRSITKLDAAFCKGFGYKTSKNDAQVSTSIYARYLSNTINLYNSGSYTATASATRFHSDSNTAYRSVTIEIAATANKVTVEGNGKNWGDIAIKILPRGNRPLYLNLDKFSAYGRAGAALIDASACQVLYLNVNNATIKGGEATVSNARAAIEANELHISGGRVTIYGGRALLDVGEPRQFSNGSSGIRCERLTVSATSLSVYGGDGVNAAPNGKAGTNGANASGKTVKGGNGGKGDDGRSGGIGGDAVIIGAAMTIEYGSSVYLYGGKGGNGTDGYCGGNGGRGSDGVNGGPAKFSVAPGDGGNGGRGGNGGAGGRGGSPLLNKNLQFNNVEVRNEGHLTLRYGTCGNGGNRAAGGLGGSAGAAARKWPTNTMVYGQNGYTGASGIAGSGGIIIPVMKDAIKGAGAVEIGSYTNGKNGV